MAVFPISYFVMAPFAKTRGCNIHLRRRTVRKGAGQPGVQSQWVGTTWFRRLVQKDSCFERTKNQTDKSVMCADFRSTPETAILTVSFRVFDVCVPKFICSIKHTCEGTVLDDNQVPQSIYQWFVECSVVIFRRSGRGPPLVPRCHPILQQTLTSSVFTGRSATLNSLFLQIGAS
jgi:hypothetical protein